MDFDISRFKGTDKLYDILSKGVTYKLIKDENDLEEKDKLEIKKLKEKIIKSELLDLSRYDVMGDIDLLINNIPEGLTPLEKVRWIYIKLGELFSYDYRIVNDPSYGDVRRVNPSKFIGRYQSCVQISEIFSLILNSIPDVKSNIIVRKLPDHPFAVRVEHVSNEVILNDSGKSLKLLLDLTLDLYLIQSGCMTNHFGYEDDGSGTYDIIPLKDIRSMDKKISLVGDEGYTDDRIKEIKDLINSISDLPDKEIIEYRLSLINNLVKKFHGYHEGKQYIGMLFRELLGLDYDEYNLYYHEENDINLKTVYRIKCGEAEKWIVYSNNSGFISTTKEKLNMILNQGWITNSRSLSETVNSNNSDTKIIR